MKIKQLSFIFSTILIAQGCVGPDHWSRIQPQYQAFCKVQKYDEAEALAKKSKQYAAKTYGEGHPELIGPTSGLAFIGVYQKDYKKAEEYAKQALELTVKKRADNPYQIALAYQNLGVIYKLQQNYEMARQTFEKSLEINKKNMAKKDEDLFFDNLNSLYLCCIDEKLYQRALEYVQKEKAYLEEKYDIPNKPYSQLKKTGSIWVGYQEPSKENHERYATALSREAYVFTLLGKKTEAKDFYLKALNLKKELYGENHFSLIEEVNNLFVLYQEQKHLELAREYGEKRAYLLERTQGAKHPFTIAAMIQLGQLYIQIHDYKKALMNYKRLLLIVEANEPVNTNNMKFVLKKLIEVCRLDNRNDLIKMYEKRLKEMGQEQV